MSKPDLFKDIIPSIIGDRYGKKKKLEIEETDYNMFVINKAISAHRDCVLYCNFINENFRIPNTIKYKYLVERIKGISRHFVKWPKKITDENVALIRKHYSCGLNEANQYLNLLSEEQIENIRRRYVSGVVK